MKMIRFGAVATLVAVLLSGCIPPNGLLNDDSESPSAKERQEVTEEVAEPIKTYTDETAPNLIGLPLSDALTLAEGVVVEEKLSNGGKIRNEENFIVVEQTVTDRGLLVLSVVKRSNMLFYNETVQSDKIVSAVKRNFGLSDDQEFHKYEATSINESKWVSEVQGIHLIDGGLRVFLNESQNVEVAKSAVANIRLILKEGDLSDGVDEIIVYRGNVDIVLWRSKRVV